MIDEAYSQLLMVRTDLPIEELLALDRVQKGPPIKCRGNHALAQGESDRSVQSAPDIDEVLEKYLQGGLELKRRREKVGRVLRRLCVDDLIRNSGTRSRPLAVSLRR